MSGPATPQPKRVLQQGCKGGDVLAVQRALYVALRERKLKATNSKNGDYGAKTIADVKAIQRAYKIDQTGRVGLNTLAALWNRPTMFDAGSFDPYGVSLIMRVALGHPTKVDPKLKHGANGPHVKALQRMLWRSLGADATNQRNGEWGDGTSLDLRRYLRRADWASRSPNTVSQSTWAALWAFGDQRAKELARKVTVTPDQAIREHIRSWGEWYVQNARSITYAQRRPYPKTGHLPMQTDCSGSAHHVLFMAGCPNDPSGRGYDGQGYTGTMYQRGTRVSLSANLLPGDCVFYGNQGGGVPSHVVIVIGPGDRALNFGANPPHYVYISSYWRSNLRSDVGARRYF